MRPLNPRQALFVDAYLADRKRDATAAARKAGYGPRGVGVQAHRLLASAVVRSAIDERLAKVHAKYQLTQERVTRELAAIAFSNVDDYQVGDDGRVTVRDGKPKRLTRAVASVKRRTTHSTNGDGETVTEHHTEYRLWDKPRALELAMKHLGMLNEDAARIAVGVNVSVNTRQRWQIGVGEDGQPQYLEFP